MILFLGVPFKPYWDGLGIDFNGDEIYHISYAEYEKNKWHELWVFYLFLSYTQTTVLKIRFLFTCSRVEFRQCLAMRFFNNIFLTDIHQRNFQSMH